MSLTQENIDNQSPTITYFAKLVLALKGALKMNCGVTIRIVLLVVLLVVMFNSELYVSFKMFDSSGCEEESYVATWNIPQSQCTIHVDFFNGEEYILSYNPTNQTLVCMLYSSESNCEHLLETRVFNVGSCLSISEWFVELNVTDGKPIDYTTSGEWALVHLFGHAVQQIEDLWQMVLFAPIDGVAVCLCTRDYFVISDALRPINFFFYPRNLSESTNGTWLIPMKLYSDVISITHSLLHGKTGSFDCIDEVQANEIVETIPDDSIDEYEKLQYYYDDTCETQVFLSRAVRLDQIDSLCSVVVWSNYFRYALYQYSKSQCGPTNFDPFFYRIIPSDQILEKCVPTVLPFWLKDRVDDDLPIFMEYIVGKDPYYPSRIAMILLLDERCDYDFSHILEDPGLGRVYYFDELQCLSADQIGVMNEIGSFQGYCDQGELVIFWYYDSNNCRGAYNLRGYSETGNNTICYETLTQNLNQTTIISCIPRKCGKFDENDPNVCYGVGICVEKDYCICESGYYGNLCQLYYCNGIEKNEPDVCYGNGDCVSPDNCACFESFSGEFCETDDLVFFFINIFLPIAGSFLVLLCILCAIMCIPCFFLCCLVTTNGCIVVFGISGYAAFQKRRLNKFEKLDDFDVILHEQLLEKDTSVAHLKINKSLFEIPINEVKILKLIGSGGSGALVFKARWRGNQVAFKCFKTRRICSSQVTFDLFEAEVNLIANLSHPYIIRFFGASLKPPRVGFVMEFCENGEILNFLCEYRKSKQQGYPLTEKIRMCKEMISAIEYIHSRTVIHRDLKVDNILIDSGENTKLMDFGISRFVEENDGLKTKNIGTSIYMAPEILHGVYTNKIDTFSFAILMWVLFTEDQKPYGKQSFQIELRVANDPKFRPKIEEVERKLGNLKENQWICDTIVKCWDHEPDKRPTFLELSEVFERKRNSGILSDVSEVEETT